MKLGLADCGHMGNMEVASKRKSLRQTLAEGPLLLAPPPKSEAMPRTELSIIADARRPAPPPGLFIREDGGEASSRSVGALPCAAACAAEPSLPAFLGAAPLDWTAECRLVVERAEDRAAEDRAEARWRPPWAPRCAPPVATAG